MAASQSNCVVRLFVNAPKIKDANRVLFWDLAVNCFEVCRPLCVGLKRYEYEKRDRG